MAKNTNARMRFISGPANMMMTRLRTGRLLEHAVVVLGPDLLQRLRPGVVDQAAERPGGRARSVVPSEPFAGGNMPIMRM